MTERPDFTEFYSATFGQLTTQLHAFGGNHAESQDLVQEAFCRAFARWDKVSGYDDPLAWVRKVAWNLAISRWRRRNWLRGRQHDLAASAVDGPNGLAVDLRRALARLPANHRQAVILYYLADMPIVDIAELTGVAEGTVKAWLHRARTALRTILGAEFKEATSV